LTRVITTIALTGFLVGGVAVTSIFGRDSAPAASSATATINGPVSNVESKQDRLAIATIAPTSFEPPQAAPSSEVMRQAFASAAASSVPDDVAAPKLAAPPATSHAAPKPKLVSKPATPKSSALLSDTQIAGIKERLKLSSAQEYYWPAVESALRAVARKIHATHQADPRATGAPIDPDAEEVQQLKSAAMPLLFQLREDQKREVRTLARLIGLEKVAEQI
jgi:hypothetical protein